MPIPEKALALYRQRLDAALKNTGQHAYDTVGEYLKLMKPILTKLNRPAEWSGKVAAIREQYRNRPLLMNVLDKIEGKTRTIVETQRGRRRK